MEAARKSFFNNKKPSMKLLPVQFKSQKIQK
jgi:hypothetical protein